MPTRKHCRRDGSDCGTRSFDFAQDRSWGYDPARGTAFSTYAWVAIWRQVYRRRQELGRDTDVCLSEMPATDVMPDLAEELDRELTTSALHELVGQLPKRLRRVILVLSPDPNLPPSPKLRYRSTYRYLGKDDLNEETIKIFSPFEIGVRLFDYSPLEPLLAAHIYVDSAKG